MMPDDFSLTTNPILNTRLKWEIWTPPETKTQEDVDAAYCKGYNEGYERCNEINGYTYTAKGITRGEVTSLTLSCTVCRACNRLTAIANYCSWCGAKRLP